MNQIFYARFIEYLKDRKVRIYGLKGYAKGDRFIMGGKLGIISGTYEVLEQKENEIIAFRLLDNTENDKTGGKC